MRRGRGNRGLYDDVLIDVMRASSGGCGRSGEGAGAPGELQIVPAAVSVDIEQFPADIEITDAPRLQR